MKLTGTYIIVLCNPYASMDLHVNSVSCTLHIVDLSTIDMN
jgi:hypothetical protein